MVSLFFYAALLPLLRAYDTSEDLPDPTPSGGNELLCKLKKAVNFRDMFGVHKWNSAKLFTPNPKSTCAVVSSSGVLRASEFGQDIDLADRIFRFNQAETEGWEKYVGYRKDIYVWNDIAPIAKEGDVWEAKPGVTYVQFLKFASELEKAKKLREDDEEGSTFLIVWPNNMEASMREFMKTTYPEEWFPKKVKSMFHSDEDKDADEDEMEQRFAPSTGVMGMLLALTMCGEVRTYGMAASKAEFDDSLPYHYWDENAKGGANAATNNFHVTFSAEKDLWRRLSNTPADVIDATAAAVIKGFPAVDCSAYDDSDLPPELDVSPFGSLLSFRGGQTGKYCSDRGEDGVVCMADSVGDMEKFTIVNAGGGKVGLLGPAKSQYCTLEFEQDSFFKCNREGIGGPREKWVITDVGQDLHKTNRKFTVQGEDGMKFCSDTGTGIQCDRASADSSEHFWLEATDDTFLTGLSEVSSGVHQSPASGRCWLMAVLAGTAASAALTALALAARRRSALSRREPPEHGGATEPEGSCHLLLE